MSARCPGVRLAELLFAGTRRHIDQDGAARLLDQAVEVRSPSEVANIIDIVSDSVSKISTYIGDGSADSMVTARLRRRS